MSFDLEKLYGLLPAIQRLRDSERGEPLKALLGAVAEQVGVLDEDLAQLYDDQFIETSADWVIPYLGDLIGHRSLHGVAPRISSPRAEVANTIGYRRRKGTVVALEQLARDVTGWHAHVVEFFQRLSTTQSMHHLRPENRSPYVGGLTRDLTTGNLSKVERPLWEPLERLKSPFDRLTHTLDVRRIPPRRGRFNIPNIGIFVWRLSNYSRTEVTPFKLDERRYFFSPLGNNTPLFTGPETLAEFSGLSTRMNVPDPIGRRTLDTYFSDYYGAGKSLLLSDGEAAFSADQVVVCDLSDLPGGKWAHQPESKIAIDPVLGRIAFPTSLPEPTDLRTTFQEGFSADLGGGEYDRSDSIAGDSLFRQPGVWQIGVSSRAPLVAGVIVATLVEAVAAWNDQVALVPEAVGVISILDSATYAADLTGAETIQVPAGSKLLLIAAEWPEVEETSGERRRVPGQFNAEGCRPLLRGHLSIETHATGSEEAGEIYLNGLLVEGWIEVVQTSGDESSGALGICSLTHCTLVPGRALTTDNFPQQPREPSLLLSAPGVGLDIDHSIVGGIRTTASVATSISHSIVDSTSRCGVAFSAADGYGAGGKVSFENCTVIGKVHTGLLELASNTIFFARRAVHDAWTAPVLSEQRQAGCVRFSFVPPGSRTPRRYRCQPTSEEAASRVMPQFSSLRYGEPAYAQLSQRCPLEIFNGADDESEMGAYHDLFEPQRLANLGVRLDEYLRFGLEAGVYFEPQIESQAVNAPPYGYGADGDLCGDEGETLPGIGAHLI